MTQRGATFEAGALSVRFANPWLLVLLVFLVPLTLWTGTRLSVLGPYRRTVIIATRLVILLLLVVSLARVQVVSSSDILDVLFVLDGSESVPQPQKQQALAFLRGELKKMGRRDRAGVVVFGRHAVVEEMPTASLRIEKLLSEPDRTATDIGEALRLAMAILGGENKKRIVLVSDGNENEGSAVEAAQSARAHGIPIDVFPLSYEYRNDVAVEGVAVDSRVHVDEAFEMKVFVRSDRDAPARLAVYRDNDLVASQDVRLEGGKKNAFVLTGQIEKPGFHVYRVQVDSAGDRNLANNVGYAFTFAAGPPRILFLDGNPPEQNRLVPVLMSERIEVDYADAEGLPDDLGLLQNYDAVILSNVGADELGERRMKALEQAVHELGVGLVMIGGDRSFGAGGYQDTPVEKALPVYMDVAQKKLLPRGALVVILHTCEIPQGNYWAQQMALAALDVMSKRDLMGLLFYGVPSAVGGGVPATGFGEQWLFTLQEVGTKTRLRSLIRQCVPGDMPSMAKTLKMAYGALSECKAAVKHIVLISDGDPLPPSEALLNEIAKSKITLSAVCISPHNPKDAQVLRWMASVCGGNFYNVTNPQNLPKIFIKEASVVRKPLVREVRFRPRQRAFSPILSGISDSEMPPLRGYVCSTPKPLADVPLVSDADDPLLAHWRYGVGKSVAFTSDAQARWATRWLAWGKFAKFWAQLVRWVLRSQPSRNLQMQTMVEGSKGRVVIDAVDPQGRFINFLQFEASVIRPDLERERVEFKQTGPGRYEASFPVDRTGVYMVSARCEDVGGAGALITGGFVIPFSPEHKRARSNEALLRKVAAITGGRVIRPGDRRIAVFDHNLPSGRKPRPVWPRTLALAVLLVPVDVFFRRVMVDWRDVRRVLASAGAWVADRARVIVGRPRKEREEAFEALFRAKQRVRQREQTGGGPSEQFLQALERARQRADGTVLKEVSEEAVRSTGPVIVRKSEKEELRKERAPAATHTGRLLEAKRRARRKMEKSKE